MSISQKSGLELGGLESNIDKVKQDPVANLLRQFEDMPDYEPSERIRDRFDGILSMAPAMKAEELWRVFQELKHNLVGKSVDVEATKYLYWRVEKLITIRKQSRLMKPFMLANKEKTGI